MSYEFDDVAGDKRAVSRVAGVVRSLTSYALLALGVLAFWSFFATFLDLPTAAWYAPILPEVLAPTEARRQVIDVSPLIAGLFVSLAAVWLR